QAVRRVEQLQGRGGALDRGLADLVGVGESGGLSGDAAQPEAGAGVIVGGLQPAVVEAERLAGTVLEVELAVVVGGQVPGSESPRAVGIEAAVKEPPGVRRGHAALLSAGPPSRT